jgi:hypothetical protein
MSFLRAVAAYRRMYNIRGEILVCFTVDRKLDIKKIGSTYWK